jgi:DHA1 family tetracycline resistance protein-like MFS transporter
LRYQFGVAENGYLLAAFGLTMALAQGLIVPAVVPKLGVSRSLLTGLVVSVASYIGYGLASTWPAMLAVTIAGSLGAIDEPALQSVVTGEVSETEQGTIQGGLAMINSVMGIVGPVSGSFLFSQFTGPNALQPIPGIAFFAGAGLVALGLLNAAVSLRQAQRVL